MKKWQGKMKALTFSYDDGVTYDIRLSEIFNRYGMKGTFNINSGKIDTDHHFMKKDVPIQYQTRAQLIETCRGHEMAAHTRTHPHLTELPDEAVREEMISDMQALASFSGEAVVGMAYPFGNHDDRVIAILRGCGIQYARTTAVTHDFTTAADLLKWPCTCHHNDPALFDLAEAFLALHPDEPACFSIWGHSYEFATDHNWDRIETLCEMLAGKEDIFYGTNAQVLLG